MAGPTAELLSPQVGYATLLEPLGGGQTVTLAVLLYRDESCFLVATPAGTLNGATGPFEVATGEAEEGGAEVVEVEFFRGDRSLLWAFGAEAAVNPDVDPPSFIGVFGGGDEVPDGEALVFLCPQELLEDPGDYASVVDGGSAGAGAPAPGVEPPVLGHAPGALHKARSPAQPAAASGGRAAAAGRPTMASLAQQLATIAAGQEALLGAQARTDARLASLEGAGRGAGLPPAAGRGSGLFALAGGPPPGLAGLFAEAGAAPPPGLPAGAGGSAGGPARGVGAGRGRPLPGTVPPAVGGLQRPAHLPPPLDAGGVGTPIAGARDAGFIPKRPPAGPRHQPGSQRPGGNPGPPAAGAGSGLMNPELGQICAALTAQAEALGALGGRLNREPSPLDLLAGDASTDPSGPQRLSGARGAAAMEILRRELVEKPQIVTSRVRANRQTVMAGAAATFAVGATTRNYLAHEVPFGKAKTAAYLAFGLAEVFDLMEAGSWHAAEAQVAFLLVAIEQAASEDWRWQTAWLLTHLPEPPWHAVARAPRTDAVRPLTRLADPSWVAAAIAYTRDVGVIAEARKRSGKAGGKGKDKDRDDEIGA